MPPLPRVTVKQFGASGPSTDFGQFGSKTAAAPQTSQNPSVIMQLAAWATGWTAAAIGAAFNPYLEDMNGFCLVVMYFLANLFERGIASWDAGTTYFQGALVSDAANPGDVYVSLTDNNLNNALPGHSGNAQWDWWNPSGPGSGLDADTVDGFHASATPAAGKLLALDGSAQFPISVLPATIIQATTVENVVYTAVTSVIPWDDTIPQQTEGVEIMTASITPKASTSKLRVTVTLQLGVANAITPGTIASLFRDAGADAIAACGNWNDTTDFSSVTFTALVDAVATASTTFKVRVGRQSGTVEVNGYNGSRVLGGSMPSTITIEEIAAP